MASAVSNDNRKNCEIYNYAIDLSLRFDKDLVPFQVFVGGLMVKEGKALPENYKKIVENALSPMRLNKYFPANYNQKK